MGYESIERVCDSALEEKTNDFQNVKEKNFLFK